MPRPKMKFALFLNNSNGHKSIDILVTVECGHTFDVGTIHEVDSSNPVLELNGPVGILAIRDILSIIQKERLLKVDWGEKDGRLNYEMP